MKEIDNKEHDIDNPHIKETPDNTQGLEDKKAKFANSLDSLNTDGISKINEATKTNLETENKYATKIDDKVKEIEKIELTDRVAVDSFLDKRYRTVVTTEEVTLYRVYGGAKNEGKATIEGNFTTTEPAKSSEDARNKLAVLRDWNDCSYEAKIVVPKGVILQIGKVAEVHSKSTNEHYPGKADQVLLPQGWYNEHKDDWVKSIRELKKGE